MGNIILPEQSFMVLFCHSAPTHLTFRLPTGLAFVSYNYTARHEDHALLPMDDAETVFQRIAFAGGHSIPSRGGPASIMLDAGSVVHNYRCHGDSRHHTSMFAVSTKTAI